MQQWKNNKKIYKSSYLALFKKKIVSLLQLKLLFTSTLLCFMDVVQFHTTTKYSIASLILHSACQIFVTRTENNVFSISIIEIRFKYL